MAENKKSFMFYCDWQETFNALPNEKAGELIKHILMYVNDESPTSDDLLINAVFANIKNQLKRDLKKWESTIDKRSDAGKKSAAKRKFDKWLKDNPEVKKISIKDHLFEKGRCIKYRNESEIDSINWFYYEYCINFHEQMSTNPTSVESDEQKTTKSTVKDIDTVIVKDKVIVKKDINTRKREFYNSLIPYLETYGNEMLKNFYEYWTEHGEKDRKFRKEKQKSFNIELRLKTWKKRSKNFNSNNSKPQTLAEKMKQDYGIQ